MLRQPRPQPPLSPISTEADPRLRQAHEVDLHLVEIGLCRISSQAGLGEDVAVEQADKIGQVSGLVACSSESSSPSSLQALCSAKASGGRIQGVGESAKTPLFKVDQQQGKCCWCDARYPRSLPQSGWPVA